MPTKVYRSTVGAPVDPADAKISVFDRGFLYGDSVYETMRTSGGAPVELRPCGRGECQSGGTDQEAGHGMSTDGHRNSPCWNLSGDRQTMLPGRHGKGGKRFVSGLLRMCNRFGERQETGIR